MLEESRLTQEHTAAKVGRGLAHGKIILMGEHAVVYDYPAISMPLTGVQVEAIVSTTQHQASYLSCRYYKGPLKEAPQSLENLKAAIQLALKHCHAPQEALHYRIHSQIPQERGMGSSAAVAVALVRAICDYYQVVITDEVLQFMVNQAEVIAHGSPSGLDTLMTSTTQPVLYRKGHTPQPFAMAMGGYLVVADSGQAGQTKQAVQQVQLLAESSPKLVSQAMTAIGEFTQQAHQAIQAGDMVQLGRVMTYNHYYLSQLMVSTPDLDRIVKAAWLGGAYGAKLTGGGLGGCVIALAANHDIAEKVAEAMRQAGARQTWMMVI